MATINRPNVKIFQQFEGTPVATTSSLNAVIVGPRKDFLDIADATDKTNAFVGNYDPALDQTFAYPSKEPSSEVDLSSVKVFLDKAKLKYLDKDPGTDQYDFRTIFGHKNRLRTAGDTNSDELVFEEFTNSAGTTFLRSVEFLDRDVQNGDCVTITGVTGSGTITHTTKVIDIISDKIAATISAATPDAANAGTQALSIGATTPGVGNTGDDTVVYSGTYVGDLGQGILDDTYTLTVLTGGTNPNISAVTPNGGNTGDDTLTAGGTFDSPVSVTYTAEVTTAGAAGVAELTITGSDSSSETITVTAFALALPFGNTGLTVTVTDGGDTVMTLGDQFSWSATPSTATLGVTTTSGLDNVISRVFPGFGAAFSVGGNGLEATVTDGGDVVLSAGDTFEVDVSAAYDAVVPAMSGDYEDIKDRTYTIEVTRGGLYGTAEITVTSNIIDGSSPQVVAVATALEVGNFGIETTFAANTQGGLLLGEKWTVVATGEKNGARKTLILQKNIPADILNEPATIGAALVATVTGDDTVASGGTYTDSLDALSTDRQEVYTVTITTGGAPGVAEMTVTSSSGLDDAPAAVVSAFGAAQAVGSLGVTITFTDGGDGLLTLNDSWTITVTKLNLGVTMSIEKADREVSRFREDAPAVSAWDPTANDVTIKQNLRLSDPSFDNGNTFLDVIAGDIHITYCAIRQDFVNSLISVESDAEIVSELGRIDLLNPVAYAASKALLNSNNSAIRVLTIRSDDQAGYSEALEFLESRVDVYSLVPLTTDRLIYQQFIAHVEAMSDPCRGRFRRTYLSPLLEEIEGLVTTFLSAGVVTDFLATVDDSITTGEFTFVEIDAGTPIDIIDLGVRENDLFRVKYALDLDGNEVFQEFKILDVISDSTFQIETGLSAAITIAEKFEIHRPLTKDEQAERHAAYASSVGNRRVTVVYPDFINAGSEVAEGFHLSSALAGLRQGVPNHQPVTNFQILGFTDAPRSSGYFSDTQLDVLANGGIMIITQEVAGEIPFIRHQLTSDVTTVETREESIQTNVDSISILLKNVTKPFLGKFNNTPRFLGLLRNTIINNLNPLLSEVNIQAGPQLLDFNINRLIQDPTFADTVCAELDITVPAPVNQIKITILI